MSALPYEYILRRDCDAPHCSNLTREQRQERIDGIRYVHAYAPEQGEIDPARGILLGNWNEYSRRATDLLQRAGYAIEWEDEWTECGNCARAIRTSPTSYRWQPAYVQYQDGEILCLECADIGDYLRELEDNPRRCCFAIVDPAEHGYVRVSEEGEYENGLHPGQDDNPGEILEGLHAQGITGVVFRVPSTGQFDINFETWRRRSP